MEQFNQFLSRLNRSQIIRWTAIYLLIDAIINGCGGLLLALAGGLAAGVGAITAESGLTGTEGAAAASQLTGIGATAIILAVLWLISVPIFAVASFGLFRRKSWARMAAVIALAISAVLSLLSLGNSGLNIIGLVISVFGVYLFWTDAGIKQELSQ